MATQKRTYTYDPELVTVTVNGVFVTGFIENSKIEAEKNENSIEPYVGVDGLVHYAKNADKTGTITLALTNTSPSLPYLRDLARTQEEFNVSIVDMNEHGENIVSDGCVILKDADIRAGKEIEEYEIEIFVPYMY